MCLEQAKAEAEAAREAEKRALLEAAEVEAGGGGNDDGAGEGGDDGNGGGGGGGDDGSDGDEEEEDKEGRLSRDEVRARDQPRRDRPRSKSRYVFTLVVTPRIP